jgi:NSS family neurotransmitter:Na+ symporter
MGTTGIVVSLTFFLLMSIAALTSSISILEVPVAYLIEERQQDRKRAVIIASSSITLISATIILNLDTLFGLVITATTRYGQPLLGLALCVYAGWIWHRSAILKELKKGNPRVEEGLFWKVWPWYVKFVCPAIILAIFVQSVRG